MSAVSVSRAARRFISVATGPRTILPAVMRPIRVHTRRALLGVLVVIALVGLAATPARSQLPVTRELAERAALAAGPRVALARADSAEARAALITAHARPNPSLVASYTADKPTKHLSLDIPFDAPWTRRPRGSA